MEPQIGSYEMERQVEKYENRIGPNSISMVTKIGNYDMGPK